MNGHVCPWWVGYLLINPLRKLRHNPHKILSPYVKQGMTVLDLGCAMGFFTLEMARLVGESGQVIAVDIQERMLAGLRKRARRQRLDHRITVHLCQPTSIGVSESVDFALAFAVAHEVPDSKAFFSQVKSVLKPGAKLLLIEPKLPVSEEKFRELVADAVAAGLRLVEETGLNVGRNAVFIAP